MTRPARTPRFGSKIHMLPGGECEAESSLIEPVAADELDTVVVTGKTLTDRGRRSYKSWPSALPAWTTSTSWTTSTLP